MVRQVRSGEVRFLRARCVKLRYGAAGVASQVFVRYILSGWGSLRQGRQGLLR
jgi:hypothetical protein